MQFLVKKMGKKAIQWFFHNNFLTFIVMNIFYEFYNSIRQVNIGRSYNFLLRVWQLFIKSLHLKSCYFLKDFNKCKKEFADDTSLFHC